MIAKNKLPLLIEKINDLYNPKDILCVSAKYDKGMEYLLNYFLSLPHRENLTPKQLLDINTQKFFSDNDKVETFVQTDSQQLAIDMTREAIFNNLRNEIPYYIHIENTEWREGPKGLHLEQLLTVPNNHYKIILYSQQNLENVKKQTIESLKNLLKKEIFLHYKIKVLKKK
jgi:GTPase Era involved in 16S rRNA processing